MQSEAADPKESKLDGRIPTSVQILGVTPACCIAVILQGFGVCLSKVRACLLRREPYVMLLRRLWLMERN